MPDKLKYPRFGGDRKLTEGTLAGCECCNNGTHATHEVTVEVAEGNAFAPWFVNVCAYHVGLARRWYTFEEFMEHYTKKGATNEDRRTES